MDSRARPTTLAIAAHSVFAIEIHVGREVALPAHIVRID